MTRKWAPPFKPKKPGDKRTHAVTVRLTPDEFARLQEVVRPGEALTDFVRRALIYVLDEVDNLR